MALPRRDPWIRPRACVACAVVPPLQLPRRWGGRIRQSSSGGHLIPTCGGEAARLCGPYSFCRARGGSCSGAISHAVKTYVATPSDRQRDWLIVDATGQTLGRLATQIADALRGKRKPTYTPHIDTGDFVVVINAEKISVSGNKLADKLYHRHSG